MTAAIESSRLCPPDDALARFVDGVLPDASRAEIERHIQMCSVCRRIAHDRRSASLDTSADRLRGLLVESQPARLGRYEVVNRIGAGAMGTVYEARDPDLERTVAVKCVAIRDSATLARHRERLREEAQALARIADPRVVRIYDVGDQDGLLFLVMERVEGLTLRAWVKRRSAAEIVTAYAEAGRVLGALHRRGLVHGDFKPDNVIVEPGGRVRVLDFGLARSLAEDTEPGTRGSGRGRGTPVYMAPELLAGEASTPATDQWAWGVSLFEALCGRRPFSGQDLEELRESASQARLRWPSPPPRRVRKAVGRALATTPERRWSSMDACVRALSPRRRRAFAAAIGIAAVVGLLAPTTAPAPEASQDPVSWPAPWDDAATDRVHPPPPLALERIVFELRAELTDAQWLANADAVERARAKVDAVLTEAESIGFSALTGEALVIRGRLLRRQGEVEPAIADLERAHALAIAIGYDAVAAHAAEQLVCLNGIERGNVEDSERWARHAAAAIASGDLALQRGTLANSRGLVAMAHHDIEAARGHFERALVGMRKAGAEPAFLVNPRFNLGNILLRLGLTAQAEATMRAALAGPFSHGEVMGPNRGIMLIGLGMALDAQGKGQEAEQTLAAAIRALESGTPQELMLAHALYNLGAIRLDDSDIANAVDPLERAVALYENTVGPDHADTALAQAVLGDVLSLLGRHDEANALLAAARVTMRASKEPADPELIQVLRMVARAEGARGDLARGAQTLRDALTEAEAAGGPPHEIGLLLNSLGRLERERGNLDESESLARRAIAIEGESTNAHYRSVRRENLALTLRDAERFDEAFEVLDEGLALAGALHDSARPRTAALLSVRGTIGLRAGRPELAAASFEQALAMLDPADDRQRIEWLVLLAKAESELGRSDAAATTMSSCRELAARTEDGPETLQAAEDWLSN